MRTLPGITCPPEAPPGSLNCAWNTWGLSLTPSSASVTQHQVCQGTEQHVVFGGDAWLLTIRPIRPFGPLPALSQDEYDHLLVFYFGNGANWQAC